MITPAPVISATGQTILGEADDIGEARMRIHLDADGSWSGSVVVRARVRGSGIAAGSAPAIAYDSLLDTSTNPLTAAITADALIDVPAGGMDVILDATVTTGKMTVYAVPLLG